jgi:hypothetical protein
MKCCICKGEIQAHSHNGKVYWSEGHNAQPLVDGRCCDTCNGYVVGFRIFCISGPTLDFEEQRLITIEMARTSNKKNGEEEE